MTHLEHARSLVKLNEADPFWPAKLADSALRHAPDSWSEEIAKRGGALAAAGEPTEIAVLAAFFEVRAERLLPAEQLAQLEGPSESELEREAERAELAALCREAVAWWCAEYPLLCGIRGVEPTLEEVPEFAHEACRAAWGTAAAIPPEPEAPAPPPALVPLSDWPEEEIRHDWRGMTATEKRIFREAFDRAKPSESKPGEAARYAHRKVLDYRVDRAEAAAAALDGRIVA